MDDISNLFETLPLSEKQQAKVKAIKIKATELFLVIREISEPRYQALAKTELEQVVLWAVKGISREPR